MSLTDGKGPTDREITVKVKVCGREHGGPHNDAMVYGHFEDTRTCLRIGHTRTWAYDVRRTGTSSSTMKGSAA